MTPRKRKVKSVKDSCDELWSLVIRTRARGVCERCGREPEDSRGFHAHHAYGRSNHRLRFELRNGCAFCWPCHHWAETTPLEFADWFREHRAADADFLEAEHRRGIIKRNLNDYLELEAQLAEQLKQSR